MVRPPTKDDEAFQEYTTRSYRLARGVLKKGKPSVWVRFTPTLFEQIRTEALRRHWSFGRMVNHLCEASIDGIE